MTIEVAGYRFDGERQLTSHVLSIREKYEHNKRIELESGDGRFLSGLIRRYPQWPLKFQSGITAFKTGRYQSLNAKGFSRVDRSGHVLAFPYRSCIHGIDPDSEKIEHALAWRAIEHTLYTFERQQDKRCSGCSEPLTKTLARHMPPRTLVGLWNQFKENCIDAPTKNGKFTSRDYLIDWQLTHKRQAMLERLCPRCYYQLSENKT